MLKVVSHTVRLVVLLFDDFRATQIQILYWIIMFTIFISFLYFISSASNIYSFITKNKFLCFLEDLQNIFKIFLPPMETKKYHIN